MRLQARLGDAEGLCRLFEAEAERLAGQAETARAAAAGAGEEKPLPQAREAAHLLCRAAVIRLEE